MACRIHLTTLLAAGMLLGCQQSTPLTPPSPPPPGASANTSPTYALQSGGDSLVGAFHVSLDPATLATSVTPLRSATAQPPQGQRYDLDIANFLTPASFAITDVLLLGSGNFRVTFSHAHPFPAPDVTLPPTATNRADLGYTGRLLILTQGNLHTFYGGSVRSSCGVVLNPDGYLGAGAALANWHPSLATIFPYKLLVDESRDPREGISNGGSGLGNFAAGSGGWQRINLGSGGTGWTGYDYLHGGQVTTSSFDLSKEAVASQQFDFDVALLIQYTDPRGAGGKTNRLPGEVIKVTDFAYRLPYAALDGSKFITTVPAVVLRPQMGDSTPLGVRLRDWDAMATEADDATVGDESDVALIQTGGAGAPEVSLDVPGVLTSVLSFGSPASGDGRSSSPLVYNAVVANQADAPAGDYFGLVRAIDPEELDPGRNSYHVGVDPNTLAPDMARTINSRTYQVVPVFVGPAVPTILAVTPNGIVGAIDQEITFSALVEGEATSFSWDFGPAAVPGSSSDPTPFIKLPGIPGVYGGDLVVSNDGGDSATFPFTYQVTSPQPPRWASHVITSATWGSYTRPTPGFSAIINNRICAAFQPQEAGVPPQPINFIRATVANPTAPSDWVIHEIGEEGVNPSIAEVDGVPALTFREKSTGDLVYGFASSTAPASDLDWTFHTLEAGPCDFGSIIELAGRPAMSFLDGTTLVYSRSSMAHPTNSGHWSTHQIALNANANPRLIRITNSGAERAVLLASISDALYLFFATVEEPSEFAEWNPSYLAGDNSPELAVTGVTDPSGADLVYVTWREPTTGTLRMRQGTVIHSSSDYLSFAPAISLGTLSQYCRPGIGIVNGRPVIGSTLANTTRLQVTRALNAFPGSFDWATQTPLALDGTDLDACDLYQVGNHIGILYINLSSPATLSYAESDLPW